MNAMTQIFIRAITTSFRASTEKEVTTAIQELLNNAGVFEIIFSPLAAYWKSTEQGELLCQIRTDLPLDTIQKLFADTWQADTADIQWSNIYLPASSFLWISA